MFALIINALRDRVRHAVFRFHVQRKHWHRARQVLSSALGANERWAQKQLQSGAFENVVVLSFQDEIWTSEQYADAVQKAIANCELELMRYLVILGSRYYPDSAALGELRRSVAGISERNEGRQ